MLKRHMNFFSSTLYYIEFRIVYVTIFTRDTEPQTKTDLLGLVKRFRCGQNLPNIHGQWVVGEFSAC